MIVLWFSILPYVVEVFKYRSFIQSHFIIDADLLSAFIGVLGLYLYSKSRLKSNINYLFLISYLLVAFIHLKFKFMDKIEYPNYVYSHFRLDWGPLGNIAEKLLQYFVITEILKRYASSIVILLQKFNHYFGKTHLNQKLSILLILIIGVSNVFSFNKMIYSRQLDIAEYLFFNSRNYDKETYAKYLAIGSFYLMLKSFNSAYPNATLFIPPQTTDWVYEGNMPLIRGIIYPQNVFRFSTNEDTPDSNSYTLVSCGYKVKNNLKCYPSYVETHGVMGLLVDEKGLVQNNSTISASLLRDTSNIGFVKAN